MGALRGWHIVVLLVVVLLLFGAPKLPELARSVGKSLHILRDETKSLKDDGKDEANSGTAQSTPDSTVDTSDLERGSSSASSTGDDDARGGK